MGRSDMSQGNSKVELRGFEPLTPRPPVRISTIRLPGALPKTALDLGFCPVSLSRQISRSCKHSRPRCGPGLPVSTFGGVFLEELLNWSKPISERIRASGNPEATNVETRLQISARHVAASKLGVSLFDQPESLSVWARGATVQTAALMMVFGNGQTSIDLCASSLLRWHGHAPKPGRDYDFTDLQRLIGDGHLSLNAREAAWVDGVGESQTGTDLLDFRHAIIHRVVSQSATVTLGGGGPSYTISASTAQAGMEEGVDTLGRAAQFAEERWRQFWEALDTG